MKIIVDMMTGARRAIGALVRLDTPMSNAVVRWQERQYAERESAAMLELHAKVKADNPQLAGKKLYETIVARRLACDETEASEIVRHADESYARWPDVRNLTFRDVVHYMVVQHLLSQGTDRVGTLARTEQTIMEAIPSEL